MDIFQPRKLEEIKSEKSDVLDPQKGFLTLEPGVTQPQKLSPDFHQRPIYQRLRPRKKEDFPELIKEYYLFHHFVWMTHGMSHVDPKDKYDPLAEFYLRSEKFQGLYLLPMRERLFYGVARMPDEAATEFALMAIHRDQAKDLLFWLDGFTLFAGSPSRYQWRALRQHLPFIEGKPLHPDDPEVIGLFGIDALGYSMHWRYYQNGFGCCRDVPVTKETTKLDDQKQEG